MTDEGQEVTQEQTFAELLEEGYDYTQPRRGQVYEAVILDIGDNDILVDLGVKRDGLIPPRDLSFVEDERVEALKVGDRIPVSVMKTWGQEDIILVSYNRGLQQEDWLRAQELLESGEIVECEIIDSNRGGVLVSFGRVRGFVPNSHLTSLASGIRHGHLSEAKEEMIGEVIPLAVIEVNQRRRRLVMSRRAADRQARKKLLEALTDGEVRMGIVRNLVDFGAFVDLGGVDGLVHISEMAWHHVKDPRDELEIGEEVQVIVLSVDKERERIALSRKRLLPDPFESVTENLREGQSVPGTVTNVVDFGAFVDIGQGVEGLVHVSEIPELEELRASLEPGVTVTVQVLGVNETERQISLRLEAVCSGGTEADEADVEEGPVESGEATEEGDLEAQEEDQPTEPLY